MSGNPLSPTATENGRSAEGLHDLLNLPDEDDSTPAPLDNTHTSIEGLAGTLMSQKNAKGHLPHRKKLDRSKSFRSNEFERDAAINPEGSSLQLQYLHCSRLCVPTRRSRTSLSSPICYSGSTFLICETQVRMRLCDKLQLKDTDLCNATGICVTLEIGRCHGLHF